MVKRSRKKISAKRKKITSKKAKKISRKAKASARAKAKAKLQFLEDKELYDFLHNIVGNEGIQVVKRITEKECSDVDLSETMELKPNLIRKHLYALYEAGVVTYRRHRSKTGWYTYFWKLHPDRISAVIGSKRGSEMKKLHELLEHERRNQFYECKNRCTRVIFEEAMEAQFKCGKCQDTLEFIDNRERLNELERRIEELSRQTQFRGA